MLSFLGVGGRKTNIPPPGSAARASIAGGSADGRPTLMSREGWMSKEGEVFKTWHKRFFRLSGLTLTYYTEKEQVKGVIPLQNAIVRETVRKGLECGFEVIVNPTAATREGVVSAAGSASEVQYSPSGVAAPTSSASATPTVDQTERIYYLCIDTTSPPSLAHELRDAWITVLRNNMAYELNLRVWLASREEMYLTELAAARREIEEVRAAREMEQLARDTDAQEGRAALEAANKDQTEAEIKRRVEAALAEERSKPRAASAAPESDASLTSGALSGADLVVALKRKNQVLEGEVRMILAESEKAKAQAIAAAEKLEAGLRDQRAQMQADLAARQAELTQQRAQIDAQKEQMDELREQMQLRERVLQQQQAQLRQQQEQQQLADQQKAAAAAATTTAAATPAPIQTESSEETAAAAAPTDPFLDETPAPSPSSAAASAAATPTPATAPSTPTVGAAPAASTPSSASDAAPACKCECAPPCVPFSAHRSCLLKVNNLESRVASLVLERSQFESAAARHKADKKVLKQEVIRLRALMPEEAH